MSRPATATGQKRLIHSPILIVGSPRSGTSWLGEWIGSHPNVAYWEEPRTVWIRGNAWRPDDRLEEADLTPRIAHRIDKRFHRFLLASGRGRFAEKTPSNCLRLPFIHRLYPDARIIHLIRDGRAVVASMLRMLERPPDWSRVAMRLRETPWQDFPALGPLFFRDVVGRRLRHGKKAFWGPRPPGWQDWLRLPAPVMLARQWRCLVETARTDLNHFPADQRFELRYEELIADPVKSLDCVLRAAELPPAEIDMTVAAAGADAWKESLATETISQIEGEAASTLSELGYPLFTTPPLRETGKFSN